MTKASRETLRHESCLVKKKRLTLHTQRMLWHNERNFLCSASTIGTVKRSYTWLCKVAWGLYGSETTAQWKQKAGKLKPPAKRERTENSWHRHHGVCEGVSRHWDHYGDTERAQEFVWKMLMKAQMTTGRKCHLRSHVTTLAWCIGMEQKFKVKVFFIRFTLVISIFPPFLCFPTRRLLRYSN